MPTREQKLEYKRRYRLKHKEQIKEYNSKYKERRKILTRKSTVKERGLTLDQYQEMFDKQNGRCAICNVHQDELKQAMCIDHNHTTGKIRKLLCCKCNRGIGYLNENIEILQNAIKYIQDFL